MARCISDEQAQFHQISEAAAIVLGVPFMVYVASRKEPLTGAQKTGLLALAAATVYIDGNLLMKWSGSPKISEGTSDKEKDDD